MRSTSSQILSRAGRMIDDGASLREVERTLGVPRSTLRRHFPGRSRWTDPSESGRFGAMVQRAGVL